MRVVGFAGRAGSGLAFRTDLAPGNAQHLDDAVGIERCVHQDGAGRAVGAFGPEVIGRGHRGSTGLADDDAHDHAVRLVRTAPDVVNTRNVERVLPAGTDRHDRRGERFDAFGYALRLAVQRVVGGYRVVG